MRVKDSNDQPAVASAVFDGPLIASPWLRWVTALAVYTGITLFFTSQGAVKYVIREEPLDWRWIFWEELVYWYVWAALTPFILWFARRFRVERPDWRRNLTLNFGLAVLLAFVHSVAMRIVSPWLLDGKALSSAIAALPGLHEKILVSLFGDFYKYWLIIGIYYAFDYYFKYRNHERAASELQLKTSRLETQLKQAELDALKMQLHPHFLFNTLNAIAILMKEDVSRAEQMLLRLGELLRVTLESAGIQRVTLAQELSFLDRYLEIEQIRFEDRLRVERDVDSDTLDAMVPNLLLQPIVENAIKHGVSARASAGRIVIRSHRVDDMLYLEVSDDGPGLSVADRQGLPAGGIGLTNTVKRLQQRFGEAYKFDLKNAPGGGLTVAIEIPFESEIDEP